MSIAPHSKRHYFRYLYIIIMIELLIPVALFSAESKNYTTKKFIKHGEYKLLVKENLITLNAEDAFLKKILEDIGQKMNIEVFARIPTEDKITIQFANLTLEEALKKFKTNYALVTDSKDKNGNIKRIVVVPEGQQANLFLKDVKKGEPKVKNGIAEEKTSRPEPFKFEFDPSKFSENNQ